MSTLTEFLLARIAERESAVTYAYETGNLAFPVMSPAELLADLGAKRRIVHEHWAVADEVGVLFCDTCHDDDSPYGARWPCNTIAALAAVYADHPDCRDEWKP